jgi:hypothetical protein
MLPGISGLFHFLLAIYQKFFSLPASAPRGRLASPLLSAGDLASLKRKML